MTGRHLIGAAGAALLAVASAGTAHAADIMPVVVPVVVPTPVVSTGPKIEITLETGVELDFDFDPFELDDGYGWTEGSVKVTTLSGWGIELSGGIGYDLAPTEIEEAGLGARVFRQVGNFEIGLGAGVEFFGMGNLYSVGPDIRYITDTVEIQNSTYFAFASGVGFVFWGNYFSIDFNPSDRLEAFAELAVEFYGGAIGVFAEGDINAAVFGPVRVLAGYDLEWGPFPTYANVYAGIELDFGRAIKPFIVPWWENDGGATFYGVDLGVNIEKEIGDGPLTVFGWTEYTIGIFGQDFEIGAGIRLEVGQD